MGTVRSIDINCHHGGEITKFGFTRNVRPSTNGVGYEPQEIYEKSTRNTGVRKNTFFEQRKRRRDEIN